jgi:hypothetical protein
VSTDDLSAIRSSDALLDSLGGRDTKPVDTGDALNARLLAFRSAAETGPDKKPASVHPISHARRTR